MLILGGIFTKVSKGTSFLVRDGILYITLTVSGSYLNNNRDITLFNSKFCKSCLQYQMTVLLSLHVIIG